MAGASGIVIVRRQQQVQDGALTQRLKSVDVRKARTQAKRRSLGRQHGFNAAAHAARRQQRQRRSSILRSLLPVDFGRPCSLLLRALTGCFFSEGSISATGTSFARSIS